VTVFGRLARRPALTHALGLLVLLKLVTPPLVPLSLPWPESAPHRPAPIAGTTPAASVSPAVLGGPSMADEPGPLAANVLPVPPARPAAPAFCARCPHPALGAWLAGSLLWWGLAARRLRRFRRLLRPAVRAAAPVQERAGQLAARLGIPRCPPVLLVPAPVAPMLWAVFGSPRVLLPAALWERLADTQRDTLLVHELAHLRRGDHWVRRLELLALGLYWWHPVTWWCRRALGEAEEQCCDAWVVWALPDEAETYAAAL